MRISSQNIVFVAGVIVALSGTMIASQFLPAAFPDVSPGTYYSDAVERMSDRGIISGYEDGSFGVGDYITREQMATILDRYEQKVILPLRNQLDEVRSSLGLGFCGDGILQTGEECDDANQNAGDGCTNICTREPACSGGYEIGEQFMASDGCNTCTCTEFGIACTEKACVTSDKCFSTADCPSDSYCSIDDGDCRYPCPAGAKCIAPCGGICLPRVNEPEAPTYECGNGICEPGETGEEVFCPVDCMTGPTCGNGICEEGEADTDDLLGTCPQDCEG